MLGPEQVERGLLDTLRAMALSISAFTWFPKCGSQFITITQELIINADSQVLPQDYWISLLGVSWGPDTSGLTSSVGDSDTH